ncbi:MULTISPECIES: hypothetical protein [Methylorubrum]|jgi:hypothetical protein|uniref:Uncharacterized protein n=1 Tax=Methylorubrum suomiense TaxID=144191 RepID=A0ABQ4UMX8_9HYPH|nr:MULTISPECIES: hypothetical protein [Methylobacteriaceae]GJE73459.1 hypothetical protein BGCPKDLD_0023 [Methylorubrum suomiense]
MPPNAVEQAKHFFRTYADTVMPLHEALVRACCAEAEVPEDLALILEDIGHDYVALSNLINEALQARRVREPA